MNKDEIINELSDKGIITKIGQEYIITEKYKELLSGITKIVVPTIPQTPTKLRFSDLLNPDTNGSDWPSQIIEAKGRERAVALMDCCEIPATAGSGYRLRGLNKEAINILGNIIESSDIQPSTMIESIKLYYKYTDMPKGFKNYLIEGDILEVYNEHIEGKLLPDLKDTNPNDQKRWH